ncbi:MAG TPA: SDR family oxidoreductase [Candidatus Sulfotelmatobacter sp.]|nr:SDR family oxidoreductase [Candidatus Sulfotelmatobacter sp.]
MRALVVGCGYVGLPLAVELKRRGHEVFGMRRSNPEALQAVGIKPLLADISQLMSFNVLPRDFDWVVNCAASGGGGADDYRRIYVEGNRNLVSWLAGSLVKKFVYTSSTSVYAQNDGSVVNEESPTEPEAETARVLVETEKLLLSAAHKGFPAVVLRVAGIYGPERGHAFKQFLRGEAVIENDGARFLNMIHRDDVVGCIIAALEHGRPGEAYNAIDCEPVSQLKFFEWLAAELKKPLPPKIAADEKTWRKRGVTNKRISNAKLLAELKYRFLFPAFREGYAAEIARSRNNLLAG